MDINRINFYNHKQLDRLHDKRAKQWLKLFIKAKQGNPEAIAAIKEHEVIDGELRSRASDAGYIWV